MKRLLVLILGIVVVVALMGLTGVFYVVAETDQVVITQFGRPIGQPVTEPGLHFKLPLVQVANYFDKRFLEWDGYPNQIPTSDKKFIWVNAIARWRVHDPLLFFQRVRDERGAQTRLDDFIDGGLRNAIANHLLVEIIRSSNREFIPSDDLTEGEETEIFNDIQFGREIITREILAAAGPRLSELGIELLDVRFKRINYVEEVRKKVYERMISERKRIAEKYRSEGFGESARIRGQREKELNIIQSEAYRTAQEIQGKADAQATKIYADAYGRDEEFYRFVRTLETYRSTLDEGTLLLLTTDAELYDTLKSSGKR